MSSVNVIIETMDRMESCKKNPSTCSDRYILKNAFVSQMTVLLGSKYAVIYAEQLPALYDALMSSTSKEDISNKMTSLIVTFIFNMFMSFISEMAVIGELDPLYTSYYQTRALYPVAVRLLNFLPEGVTGMVGDTLNNLKEMDSNKLISNATDIYGQWTNKTPQEIAAMKQKGQQYATQAQDVFNKLNDKDERNKILDKIKETSKSAIQNGDTSNIKKAMSEIINSNGTSTSNPNMFTPSAPPLVPGTSVSQPYPYFAPGNVSHPYPSPSFGQGTGVPPYQPGLLVPSAPPLDQYTISSQAPQQYPPVVQGTVVSQAPQQYPPVVQGTVVSQPQPTYRQPSYQSLDQGTVKRGGGVGRRSKHSTNKKHNRLNVKKQYRKSYKNNKNTKLRGIPYTRTKSKGKKQYTK